MSNIFQNLQLQRIATAIENGDAGGGTLTINLAGVGDMQPATASTAGAHGLVPAPQAGDNDKVLSGAGTWIDAGSGGELGDLEDVTITSPTSGESLKYDGAKWVNGNVTAELPNFIEETSGSIVTVEAAERPAKSLVVAINPVQSGSGDPSPDNIRPISGWTGANIVVRNNEFFDKTKFVAGPSNKLKLDDGAVSNQDGFSYTANFIEVSGGISVGVIGTITPLQKASRLYFYDAKKNWIGRSIAFKPPATISIPDNAKYIQFQYYMSFIDTDTIHIKPSGTETVDYQGQDYTITLPSEAGTVYGGTLDVVNGVLTVTKANIASYDGETLPGAWISDRDVYAEGTTPTTGAQVVYDLDTPITYQHTPTEVQMLLGTNNIWANTGEVKELKYIPQTYNDLLEEVTGGGVDYSLTEQDTGLKWIDGKAIYQKTISFTVSGGGYVSIPTGITGIDTLIKHEGFGRITDFVVNETAYKNPPICDYSVAMLYNFQGGELYADYRATTDAVGATFYITVWYTKI